MTTFSQRMAEFGRIVQLHTNWLVFATLGRDALTATQLAELEAYGKLPMTSTRLVDESYLLGRMRSLLKRAEYKEAARAADAVLSPAEELALDHARAKAAQHLHSVAYGTAVLPSLDPENGRKKWSAAVRTEFHAAKILGIANTIANQTDIYANSAGPSSDVSVVPTANCCEDCRDKYLDDAGNPIVFKLADLMANGSNADPGVVHTRSQGKHSQWKVTLPPLHPNCGCMLVYVPPGHGWAAGKLAVMNKSLFDIHLAKATAGVRAPGGSPTVAPKGAPSQAKEPGHPSLPDAAAPGNLPGPGRPSGGVPKPGSGTPGGQGGGKQLIACPLQNCPDGGQHEQGSGRLKEHTLQAQRSGKMTPQAEEAHRKKSEADAKDFNVKPHPNDILKSHLSEGKISSSKPLGEEDNAGVSEAYKITIEGNGSGCMKPPMHFPASVFAGFSAADGGPSMPKNSAHKSEVGAYTFASSLGLDHVPTTVTRAHDGSGGVNRTGEMSVQHWQEEHHALAVSHPEINDLTELLQAVPAEHKDKMKQKFHEIACLDFVMNNNDRHMGNLVFNKDLTNVKCIDNSLTFASGMAGHKNGMHMQLHRVGEKLQVPPHLIERFKAQSLDATMRSMPDLQPWQQVQTHVRMKYLVHLQEEYGHVPVEATRYAAVHAANEDLPADQLKEIKGSLYSAPRVPGWPANVDDRMDATNAAHDKWEMPDQLYARFTKAYAAGQVGGASEQEKSDIRMFRPAYPTGSGHALERSGFEPDSHAHKEHQKYWNDIPAWEGMSHWKSETQESAKPLRTPPDLPKTQKPAGKPSADVKTAAGKKKAPVDDPAKTAAGKKAPAARKPTELEVAHTHLQLDDDPDFKFNEEPEQALSLTDLEEVKPAKPKPPKPPVQKSLVLYLANPNAKFPLTD